MIESQRSKRFATGSEGASPLVSPPSRGSSLRAKVFGEAPKTAGGAPALPNASWATPWVWLNFLCLDAPLVAVSWQWLFARTFAVELRTSERAALFLTAWFIYLADRFADSWWLNPAAPRSLRQSFCTKHRGLWIAGLSMVGLADAWLAWRGLDHATVRAGFPLGLAAVAYLAVNSLGKLWRVLPLKELTIGALFTTGVALVPALRSARPDNEILCSAFAFGAVCALNCVSIAAWERDLDRRQRKDSLATNWPRVGDRAWLFSVATGLAALTLMTTQRSSTSLMLCVAVSSFLLAALDTVGQRIARDVRTALADLVLLTPIAVFLFTLAR